MKVFHFRKAYLIRKFNLSRQKLASFWDMKVRLLEFLRHKVIAYLSYLECKLSKTYPKLWILWLFLEDLFYSIKVWDCHFLRIDFKNKVLSWKFVISRFYLRRELGFIPLENQRLKYFSYRFWLYFRHNFLKAKIEPICLSSYLSWRPRFWKLVFFQFWTPLFMDLKITLAARRFFCFLSSNLRSWLSRNIKDVPSSNLTYKFCILCDKFPLSFSVSSIL